MTRTRAFTFAPRGPRSRPRCHPARPERRRRESAAADEGSVYSGILALTIATVAIVALLFPASAAAQRRKDFSAPTPLPSGSTLILGFLDRADRDSEVNRPVVQLAERLRALSLPGVFVELAEHSRRGEALKFIEAATGRDSKGRCTVEGCRTVRLILYGRDAGAPEVVKLARELNQRELRVALTALVDCSGAKDVVIPPNVAKAANLYQNEGPSLRAPIRIQAEDPAKTKILANQRFTVGGKWVELSDSTLSQPSGPAPGSDADTDPQVWNRVEDYILAELHSAGIPGAPAPPH